MFPIRICIIGFCIYIYFMRHVFGTLCLRPSKGSHLSTEKGTHPWAPVLWDSRGRASAVSLQSCFPWPAWCAIWVSGQTGFQQFLLSVTFLMLRLPRIMEWLQFRMHFLLLQKHAFSVISDYFRSCVFLGSFSFQFRARMASLHEWFSPRKGPPMVVMLFIPNSAALGWDYGLPAGGQSPRSAPALAVDLMSAWFCFVLYEVTLGIRVHWFEIILWLPINYYWPFLFRTLQ